MYGKWIKSYFILAILLMSMVSLSTAACPWFIKNELYSAQCGGEKVIPASSGILANDPQAIAVLDPESITIDPKYGTLDVGADGSFVYDASTGIPSGTYVTFKYSATNGVCPAKYEGTAKIQVSCKCRPPDFPPTITSGPQLMGFCAGGWGFYAIWVKDDFGVDSVKLNGADLAIWEGDNKEGRWYGWIDGTNKVDGDCVDLVCDITDTAGNTVTTTTRRCWTSPSPNGCIDEPYSPV